MANGKPATIIDLDEEVPQTIDLDEVHQPSATQKATEQTLPGSTPRLRAAVNKGVAPMVPPTKFEQENQIKENYGFTPSNVLSNAWEGAKGLVTSGAEAVKDVAPLALGLSTNPIEDTKAFAHKYVIDPAKEQFAKAANEPSAVAAAGHAAAGAIPLIGPWAAGLGEQAGTGDVGGAIGQAAGTVAAGELIPRLIKNTPALADKIARGTPLTEEGKIAAAQKQAMVVKPASMTETDYAAKIQAATPELQRIAQENPGVKTPREAVRAINKRISQIEEPISQHLRTLNAPEDMTHPAEYQGPINAAIDAEFAKDPGLYKPGEIEKAKKAVGDYLGDQPKTLQEIENNRKRLNQDADAYYHADTAGKHAIDVSDATARAQRAAANGIRDALYGDPQNPGLLEKAGLIATDASGKPIDFRTVRNSVGNLLDIRNHFEDAIVNAEKTGDWKPFQKLFTGPSIAAGGIPAAAGAVMMGGPGGLLGLLAGEGLKSWGDYLRSKNPNLNVQKMFRNLGATTAGPTVEVGTRPMPIQYANAIGPRIPQYAEPIGPNPAPQPFEMQGLQPNRTAMWQQQVGAPPPLETGAPTAPYREPIGPQLASEGPPVAIQGEQQRFHLPETPEEAPLWNLRPINVPKNVGEAAAAPAPEPGAAPPAPIREGPLRPVGAKEGLKLGEGEDLGPGLGTEHVITREGKRVGSVTVEPRPDGVLHVHWLGGEFTPADRGPLTSMLKEEYPGTEKITYDRRRLAKEATAATTEPREMNVGGAKVSQWEKLPDEAKDAIRTNNVASMNLAKTGMEDLKVGDTFVDDKGEPRRIVNIEDGKIETADGTTRTFEGGIDHRGELNNPKALLARGGKFIPPEGEGFQAEGEGYDERVRKYEDEGLTRSDAQAVVDAEDARKNEVKPMTKPGEAAKKEIQIVGGKAEHRGQFEEAVKNTPGAKMGDDGSIRLDLSRRQHPDQAGTPALRSGVFFTPEADSPFGRHYTGGQGAGYGGSQKIVLRNVEFKNPIVAKGSTGGKVPERVYDAIKGKDAYDEMRSDVLDAVGVRHFGKPNPEVLRQRVADVLEKYGGNPDRAEDIILNSEGSNKLPYAIQEHIVGAAARTAGYDAILGFSKHQGQPRLSEVFDLNRHRYPTPDMDMSEELPEEEQAAEEIRHQRLGGKSEG